MRAVCTKIGMTSSFPDSHKLNVQKNNKIRGPTGLVCVPVSEVCIYLLVYRCSEHIYSGLSWLVIIWTSRIGSVGIHNTGACSGETNTNGLSSQGWPDGISLSQIERLILGSVYMLADVHQLFFLSTE